MNSTCLFSNIPMSIRHSFLQLYKRNVINPFAPAWFQEILSRNTDRFPENRARNPNDHFSDHAKNFTEIPHGHFTDHKVFCTLTPMITKLTIWNTLFSNTEIPRGQLSDHLIYFFPTLKYRVVTLLTIRNRDCYQNTVGEFTHHSKL